MAPIDFEGLGKWTGAEIDNLLQVVAPQTFGPSAASDDSKKEPKFTTDKSSKDQLSEGKAVRDLLFGHTVYFWILEFSGLHDDLTEKSDAVSVSLLI